MIARMLTSFVTVSRESFGLLGFAEISISQSFIERES
jgi:hypothetical protein